MKPFLIVTLLATLAACNNESKTVENPTPAEEQKTEPPASDILSGCYLRVIGRDTLVAHLEQQGETVSGRLTFDNFEKDGSTGTVNGKLEGNILKLVYSFQSEGMNSVMEIWFRKDGQTLTRGNGNMDVKGDTAYYTNPPGMQYDEKDQLSKVDCASLPAKFQ